MATYRPPADGEVEPEVAGQIGVKGEGRPVAGARAHDPRTRDLVAAGRGEVELEVGVGRPHLEPGGGGGVGRHLAAPGMAEEAVAEAEGQNQPGAGGSRAR